MRNTDMMCMMYFMVAKISNYLEIARDVSRKK